MDKQSSSLKYTSDKVVKVFVLLILSIFPLYYQNAYFDILQAKYQFYYIVVITMFAFVILTILFYKLSEKKVVAAVVAQRIDYAEYALVIFGIMAAISTVQSDYIYESFWGNEGRYTGFFLVAIYIGSYFVISRFLIFRRYLLDVFLISGSLVGGWGITDYFQLDILGFKEGMHSKQRDIFFSSMGNINTYTAFVGMVMAIAVVLFLREQHNKKRCFYYYICLIIAFFAIITGNSDNAYLSIGTLLLLLPLFCCDTDSKLLRYVVVVATFFTVIQLIEWINIFFPDHVIGLDSLFGILSGFKYFYLLVAALWGITVIWYVKRKKLLKGETRNISKRFRRCWSIMIFFASVLIIYMVLDCNLFGNSEKYGALSTYLYFDENWGSDRGVAWSMAMKYFDDFSGIRKIVGFGPDTFGILMLNNDMDKINQMGVIFDNAHNEYLQLLVTMGISGLFSYLLFGFLSLKKMAKSAVGDSCVMAMFYAVLCYSAQALVNISLPITAPFMWLFLAMGIAACRNYENNIGSQKL